MYFTTVRRIKIATFKQSNSRHLEVFTISEISGRCVGSLDFNEMFSSHMKVSQTKNTWAKYVPLVHWSNYLYACEG